MFSDPEIDRLADDGCPWTDDEDPGQEAYNELTGDDGEPYPDYLLDQFADDGCPNFFED